MNANIVDEATRGAIVISAVHLRGPGAMKKCPRELINSEVDAYLRSYILIDGAIFTAINQPFSFAVK